MQRLNTGKYRRVWAYTDFGMITLLFQDDAGGLKVQDRFSSKPDAFISLLREHPTKINVYVSNSLEYMTNNYLKVGLHQVATQSICKTWPMASYQSVNRLHVSSNPVVRLMLGR